MSEQLHVRPWMRFTLVAAGIYNLTWGAATILFPTALFRWAGADLPRYPEIWQCVAMIVGVYGIGFLIASRDPLRHWPIVLVGLLGKLFGPIGFVHAALQGDLPWSWGVVILTNDLVWWVPFTVMLYEAFRYHSDTERDAEAFDFETAISEPKSQRGATLAKLSAERPVLVVFLRHSGCTFCRETLAELARQRHALQARGIDVALVHMSPLMQATQMVAKYGLEDVHRFSDPHCKIYRAFELPRAGFLNLLGPRTWWRGVQAGLFQGHGMGRQVGDGFRLHGAFLLHHGRVIESYRASLASDQIDYAGVACSIESPSFASDPVVQTSPARHAVT